MKLKIKGDNASPNGWLIEIDGKVRKDIRALTINACHGGLATVELECIVDSIEFDVEDDGGILVKETWGDRCGS